ncbi:MAG: ATP synthase F0 subunit C [Bdellovibrionota bacterium]
MKKNLFAVLALVLVSVPAFAQETVQTNAASTLGLIGIGIGIMMGLAVLGGTLGQSKAAAMALEGIARNPAASGKLTVPLILSLALMESLVLFAFLIGLFLQGSVSDVLALVK